jgi:class 3 adenylate cyclase
MDLRRFWVDNSRTVNIAAVSPELISTLHKMSSYVPRLVVRRLAHSQKEVECPETESYPACVMFADVSGFTSLTEKLSSSGDHGIEKLKNVLNTYFESLIGIVYKYGGDVIKVIYLFSRVIYLFI